jgi:hypothetical protein
VKYTGAANEDITAAEEATCPWPEEFRELYRCVAGADDRRGMFVDTGHARRTEASTSGPTRTGFHRLPLWRSLSAMLDDLAFCLERNAPMAMLAVRMAQVPAIHRGRSAGVGTRALNDAILIPKRASRTPAPTGERRDIRFPAPVSIVLAPVARREYCTFRIVRVYRSSG